MSAIISSRLITIILFALSCVALNLNTYASQQGIPFDTKSLDLTDSIHWLEDANDSIDFTAANSTLKHAYTPSDGLTFSKGYTSSAYWIRFDLAFQADSLDEQWLLEIPFPLLDYVSLYEPNNDGSYSITQTGDRRPFNQRDIDTTTFVFSITPTVETKRYYLHVKTQDSLQVPLVLWNQNVYPKHNALHTGFQGVYFGGMLVMILYNLFIFFSVRDRSYLLYICYITIFTAFQAGMQGFSFEYLWPNNTWWSNVNIPFFGVLSLFFACLFSRSVLQTKKHIPRFDKILAGVSILMFFTLPLMLFGSYNIGMLISLIVTFIFFNIILVAAILSVLKGNRTAKLFSVAWVIFLISGSISLLGITGLVELEYANTTALQIGSGIEVVLLSMVLADRINLMEQVKTELEAKSSRALAEANIHLKSTNKLKDEFIATISHEVRTPMNGVLGSAQLLMDTALTDSQHNFVNTINQSGQTLLEILNNILDYSKIEANKLEIEYIEFNLEEVINECASIFAVQSEQSGINLFVRIHRGTPLRIIGDPTRFKQILLNLISNAFKFTDSGEIIIQTKMQPGVNKNLLRVEIEDSGIGISEEQQDVLFQSFTQVDATTARKFGGTGLGLAICKKLTRLMGGNIGVRSTLEQGSCFWFNIHIDIAQEGIDLKPPTDVKVFVLLNNKRQESLLNAQLQDWGVIIESAPPTSNNFVILTDDSNLPNIKYNTKLVTLIIGNSSTEHNKISNPITAAKLYKALSATTNLPKSKTGVNPKLITQHNFSSLNVLAVDDNSTNRMIIKGLLKKFNVSADIAESGDEAAIMTSNPSNQYDLILMDIQMPGKDGYDTTRHIRAYEKIQGLEPKSIIALSAHAVKEYQSKAIESGMSGFLSKPVDQKALYEILEEINNTKLNMI